MKIYLNFSISGEITEIKTKNLIFQKENYTDYKFIHTLIHNNLNLIILFNKTSKDKNNTYLPFYSDVIYGDFLLFNIDDKNNLISLTEKKILKLLNVLEQKIEDYSSDDFNLSE